MTFDLDIWHAGSPSPCVVKFKVKVVGQSSGSQNEKMLFLQLYECTLRRDVFLVCVEFLVLKWTVRPRVIVFNVGLLKS